MGWCGFMDGCRWVGVGLWMAVGGQYCGSLLVSDFIGCS